LASLVPSFSLSRPALGFEAFQRGMKTDPAHISMVRLARLVRSAIDQLKIRLFIKDQ
jgi:hypothetical protein